MELPEFRVTLTRLNPGETAYPQGPKIPHSNTKANAQSSAESQTLFKVNARCRNARNAKKR